MASVVAGSSPPVAGPSGLNTSRGAAKRKLLPLMSTPLPNKRARVTYDEDSSPDDNSDSDYGPPSELDTDDTLSDLGYEPPRSPDTAQDSSTSITQDSTASGSQDGHVASPTAVNIVHVPQNSRCARDKTYWSRTPLRSIPLQPSTQYNPGLATPEAKAAAIPLDFFDLFFDDDMLNEIVHYTNIMIEKEKRGFAKDDQSVSKTSVTEIRAFIGVLIQAGAKQDNHRTVEEMFSNQHGAPLYRAVLSARRFNFLLRCLRFDDTTDPVERDARKRADKFTLFRNTFEKFVKNCKKHYTPGGKMTVDEQLLAFRGHCPFQMYMPNKPAKYGIKIVMACDAENAYMFNAVTYLGKEKKQDNKAKQGNVAKKLTMTLLDPYLDAGRNVTVDNWFTTLPLANELYQRKTTLVGTIRKKGYVPEWMLAKKKDRAINTSAFLFQNNATLLSYKAKMNKIVLLLSSYHHEPEIGSNGKPEMINFYNKTKGGVDTMDQMCARYSTSRRTRRWPLCMFYGLINIAVTNVFILYKLSGLATTHKERFGYLSKITLKELTIFIFTAL